ncbi:hypothetical protein CHGG_07191 [Chaetomium globosum CBS 148.51]|uniref:Uncharacterized protein n=1 Tax=Chaetomium globosum (strain ATCC 6205 / CBS 148.51 / DSM 1962 / NBRC 6347 / NRRL 1970) TaxID=306901 RepID=Q2GXW3_CHAGB|nr:uncharacterized protein CHGG_07191 [Chaetomium globosum CBS 148.51]EAQ85938.1 hypothetical protein CHGG_07191 [Chaetomium globosum CBS 148.51]
MSIRINSTHRVAWRGERARDPFEDHAHALAALAKLILRLGRCERLDAALDAPGAQSCKEPAAAFVHGRFCLCLCLPQPVPDTLAQPGAEHHPGLDICVVCCRLRLGHGIELSLNYREHANKVEVPAFRRHPSLAHVHDARLKDVRCLVRRAPRQGRGQ